MMLFAKRVSANVPPENRTSTSSADDSFRIRSKTSPACSLVSITIRYLPLASLSLCGELTSFVSAPHLDPAKPCRRRSMSRTHHLLRLAFTAVRRSPQRPFIARTDCIQRIPELGGDSRVRRVLQHAYAPAVLDLPPHLAAELEV